jgi:hypothetical protein
MVSRRHEVSWKRCERVEIGKMESTSPRDPASQVAGFRGKVIPTIRTVTEKSVRLLNILVAIALDNRPKSIL